DMPMLFLLVSTSATLCVWISCPKMMSPPSSQRQPLSAGVESIAKHLSQARANRLVHGARSVRAWSPLLRGCITIETGGAPKRKRMCDVPHSLLDKTVLPHGTSGEHQRPLGNQKTLLCSVVCSALAENQATMGKGKAAPMKTNQTKTGK